MLPLLLVLAWHVAVKATGTRLIPAPREVGIMLWDFCFGGIYDDAYSKTILTHFWASVRRVYGGFFAAAAIGVPLGLLIGRVKWVERSFGLDRHQFPQQRRRLSRSHFPHF